MLSLSATGGVAPEVWAVLTTRTVTVDMEPFYLGREKLDSSASASVLRACSMRACWSSRPAMGTVRVLGIADRTGT